MSMDYGTAYIGFKTKDGELKNYVYGYDNEIVPDIILSPDWKEQLSNASTREEMLANVFKDPWCMDDSLKDTIKEFDYDGSDIKEYRRYMNAIKKIAADDIEAVALGVVHGGKGYYQYDWRVLDFASGKVYSKSWERNDDSYNGPGEECIAEAIEELTK